MKLKKIKRPKNWNHSGLIFKKLDPSNEAEITHKRQIWENHEARFSIIQILKDDIGKKNQLRKE
jgi:hypothetical protein